MPLAPLKPCRHPGCRAVVPSGYCAAHKAQQWQHVEHGRNARPELANARRIRDSAAWKKARAWFTAQNPLCCDPWQVHGETSPALTTQVHHVEPLSARPDLAFDADNLRPLCDYCHARVEFAERNKRDTRGMFRCSPALPQPQAQAPGGLAKVQAEGPSTLTVARLHNSESFPTGAG